MKSAKALILLMLTLVISGCSSGASKQPMDFKSFNDTITAAAAKGEPWTHVPQDVCARFVGPTDGKRKIQIARQTTNVAALVVYDEYLKDDSIAGNRYEIRLARRENAWFISEALLSWRCWKDRGHQQYSSEPCI